MTSGLPKILLIMLRTLAISLAATIVLEVLGAALLGVRQRSDFMIIILVNIITNPAVVYLTNLAVFLVGQGTPAHYAALLILELSAVITEALLYRKYLSYSRIDPWLLSAVLNAFSFAMGRMIIYI
jgi:hypothetical protein